MTNQIKPQSQKKLIVFSQDKGGIGKSFVATLLYDYLFEHGVKLKTFDFDHANSTFQRFVPEAEFLDTDVDANKLAVLDTMVKSPETADVALVDILAVLDHKKAGVSTNVWLHILHNRALDGLVETIAAFVARPSLGGN